MADEAQGIITSNFGQGIGGDIDLSTQKLRLIGGVDISTDTFGNAPSGNITVEVADAILFEPNNSAQSDFGNIQTVSYQAGTAGDIQVSTRQLAIAGDGISSRTVGSGKGGTIQVSADNILLVNGSSISSATLGAGAGGNVAVTANTIEVRGCSASLPVTQHHFSFCNRYRPCRQCHYQHSKIACPRWRAHRLFYAGCRQCRYGNYNSLRTGRR